MILAFFEPSDGKSRVYVIQFHPLGRQNAQEEAADSIVVNPGNQVLGVSHLMEQPIAFGQWNITVVKEYAPG